MWLRIFLSFSLCFVNFTLVFSQNETQSKQEARTTNAQNLIIIIDDITIAEKELDSLEKIANTRGNIQQEFASRFKRLNNKIKDINALISFTDHEDPTNKQLDQLKTRATAINNELEDLKQEIADHPLDRQIVSKIEPRQYVTIYEKKRLDSNVEPIWWLTKTADPLVKKKYPEDTINNPRFLKKFYPHQQVSVVDKETTLEIRFDQEMLASNIDFYGNISLAATLDNRSIEVSPYSMIGKEQKSYGVNNRPIKEIASHFLNLFLEADDALRNYEKAHGDDFLSEAKYQSTMNSISDAIRDVRQMLDRLISNQLNANSLLPIHESEFPLENIASTLASMGHLGKNSMISQLKNDIDSLSENDLYFDSKPATLISLQDIQSEISTLSDSITSVFGGKLINDINASIEYYNSSSLIIPSLQKEIIKKLEREMKPGSQLEELMYQLSRSDKISLGEIKEISNKLKKYNTNDIIEAELRAGDASYFYLNSNYMSLLNTFPKTDGDPSKHYKLLLYNIDLCIQYMEYFRESGIESINAFLTLSELTDIRFEASYEIIKKNYEKLPIDKSLIDLIKDEKRPLYLSYIQSIIAELEYLTKRMIKLVNNQMITDSLKEYDIAINSRMHPSLARKAGATLRDNYRLYQERIAVNAGRQLFNRMLYATIDLNEAAAKENEILEIKVMWYNIDQNSQNVNEGIELSTAKFLIKKTGWHLEASESVLLIERFNEELVTVDVSPSNFKPTAGASLLWSYHNDFRGKTWWQKFNRWLEPSFGINVAYLDFDSQETFEIGAGPIVGFWGNRLFFTGGYNFSVEGQSPFYMGIGFSFYNVIEKLKIGGKLKAEVND